MKAVTQLLDSRVGRGWQRGRSPRTTENPKDIAAVLKSFELSDRSFKGREERRELGWQ